MSTVSSRSALSVSFDWDKAQSLSRATSRASSRVIKGTHGALDYVRALSRQFKLQVNNALRTGLILLESAVAHRASREGNVLAAQKCCWNVEMPVSLAIGNSRRVGWPLLQSA